MDQKEVLVGRRIESPSSMNTYVQCPRKYYYKYILQLPSSSSIYTLRGKIIHSVLEHFFTLPSHQLHHDFDTQFATHLLQLFNSFWSQAISDLEQLHLTKDEIHYYYRDSLLLLENFLRSFSAKMRTLVLTKQVPLATAFHQLTPQVEVPYLSETHGVRGFIDAIEQRDDGVYLMDYKTSSKDGITPEYKLQLAVYAFLYHHRHGVLPAMVGVNFLRFGERYLPVDHNLLRYAHKEIVTIHAQTKSDHVQDYPKHVTPLCKWKGGQCDYYDVCFGQKTLAEYTQHLVPLKTSETN